MQGTGAMPSPVMMCEAVAWMKFRDAARATELEMEHLDVR